MGKIDRILREKDAEAEKRANRIEKEFAIQWIDNEQTGDSDRIRKEIEERNLWYFIECSHCETLFLVEDSIGNTLSDRANIKPFHVHCPRCGFSNPSSENHWLRLKLALEGIADPLEMDAVCERVKRKKISKAEGNKNRLAIMEMNEALNGSDAFRALENLDTEQNAKEKYR